MKTTSKELSMALKEAGAKQESELVWRVCIDETTHLEQVMFSSNAEGMTGKKYSTFDCHELLERLPNHTHIWVSSTNNRTYTARCVYIDDSETEQCDTPAEALGKLYLWCLREGHCDE